MPDVSVFFLHEKSSFGTLAYRKAVSLILDVILPPIPGDPDKKVLLQKLKDGGIKSRMELTLYSPEELARKCSLSDSEVDALAQKCQFLRTRAWLRRRRHARQKDHRRTLRTP